MGNKKRILKVHVFGHDGGIGSEAEKLARKFKDFGRDVAVIIVGPNELQQTASLKDAEFKKIPRIIDDLGKAMLNIKSKRKNPHQDKFTKRHVNKSRW